MTARMIFRKLQIKIPSRRGLTTRKVMSRHGLSAVDHKIPVWNIQIHPVRSICSYSNSCLCHGHQCTISKQLLGVSQGHPSVCHVLRGLKTGGDRIEANYTKDYEGDEFDIKLNNKLFPDYQEDEVVKSEPKHRMIVVGSTRADAVITKAFGISRSIMEDKLSTHCCLVNGEIIQKKAKQIGVGDCIDIVLDKSDTHYKVQRTRILDVVNEKTKAGRTKMIIRLWKKAFYIEI